ncbi:hypothetical protein KQS16_002644 [Salmonella enterica]|nr:hypothetical protein [Salmonella enterica]
MDATARQRIVAAGIITKAAETLQIANMRLANLWGGNYFCTDRRCYKLIVKSTTTRPMGDLGILHCAEKNDLKMIFLP